MARPRSIYEKKTTSTLPAPELRERYHAVTQGECLISIGNVEYGLEEYDSEGWRRIGLTNKVENPFTLDSDYRSKAIVIPGKPLPEFL